MNEYRVDQVDQDDWAVLDREGRPIGIIWRTHDVPRLYRCAPTGGGRGSGIEHADFDVVLSHLFSRFSAGYSTGEIEEPGDGAR